MDRDGGIFARALRRLTSRHVVCRIAHDAADEGAARDGDRRIIRRGSDALRDRAIRIAHDAAHVLTARDVSRIRGGGGGIECAGEISDDAARLVPAAADRAVIHGRRDREVPREGSDDAAHAFARRGADETFIRKSDGACRAARIPISDDAAHAAARARHSAARACAAIRKISADGESRVRIADDAAHAAFRAARDRAVIRASIQGQRAVVIAHDTARISIRAVVAARRHRALRRGILSIRGGDRPSAIRRDDTHDAAHCVSTRNRAFIRDRAGDGACGVHITDISAYDTADVLRTRDRALIRGSAVDDDFISAIRGNSSKEAAHVIRALYGARAARTIGDRQNQALFVCVNAAYETACVILLIAIITDITGVRAGSKRQAGRIGVVCIIQANADNTARIRAAGGPDVARILRFGDGARSAVSPITGDTSDVRAAGNDRAAILDANGVGMTEIRRGDADDAAHVTARRRDVTFILYDCARANRDSAGLTCNAAGALACSDGTTCLIGNGGCSADIATRETHDAAGITATCDGSIVRDGRRSRATDVRTFARDTAGITASVNDTLSGVARLAVRRGIDGTCRFADDTAGVIFLIAAVTDETLVDDGADSRLGVTRNATDVRVIQGVHLTAVGNGARHARDAALIITGDAADHRARHKVRRRDVAVCRRAEVPIALDLRRVGGRGDGADVIAGDAAAVGVSGDRARGLIGTATDRATRIARDTAHEGASVIVIRIGADGAAVRTRGDRTRRGADDTTEAVITATRTGDINFTRVGTTSDVAADRSTRYSSEVSAAAHRSAGSTSGCARRIVAVRTVAVGRKHIDIGSVRAIRNSRFGVARHAAEDMVTADRAAGLIFRIRDGATRIAGDTAHEFTCAADGAAIGDLNAGSARDGTVRQTSDTADESRTHDTGTRSGLNRAVRRLKVRGTRAADRAGVRDRARDISARIACDAADGVRAADRAAIGDRDVGDADITRRIARDAAHVCRAADRATVGAITMINAISRSFGIVSPAGSDRRGAVRRIICLRNVSRRIIGGQITTRDRIIKIARNAAYVCARGARNIAVIGATADA